MTEKSQTHGHEDQAWQNGKSKTGRRKRNRKTGMKSVHPKQNVVSDVEREADGCGMIAILQKTRRAPSCHTKWSRAGERTRSFITTIEGHNHVITLASKAEELQNLADRLWDVKLLFVWGDFYNDGKDKQRAQKGATVCIKMWLCEACVQKRDCAPSRLSCSLSKHCRDVCHTRMRSVSGLG